MKIKFIFLTISVLILIFCFNFQKINHKQSVNPITGDISFIKKFDYKPSASTDNELRIKTHLEYVEKLLRQKDVSNLSSELQSKRIYLLDLLHKYWTAGNFPKNYDYKDQRKPCFIDKDNTICAVGYLIEQTTSRKAVEKINEEFKYDELLAMNDKTIDDWISTSGLTREECATIQPTYGPTVVPTTVVNYIPAAYGIASSAIIGINLSVNTMNSVQITKGSLSKTVPIVGLVTGVGQLFYGATMFPEQYIDKWTGSLYTNKSQRNLSMVNIGLGTSTVLLSAWNLVSNCKSKQKEKLTTWNLYGFPTQDNSTGLGLNLVKRF